MGFEPMNTGFADQRVSHFAIGALLLHRRFQMLATSELQIYHRQAWRHSLYSQEISVSLLHQ